MANPKRARKNRSFRKPRDSELRFIPLGGLGQIGKNIFALEYGEDIIVVDCGLMFPEEEMLGIDFVIPDATWLYENRERIRGLILTHGHEDHIGGLTFILPQLDVPVFGTRLTLGMASAKFRDARPDYELKATEVAAGDSFSLGCFTVNCIAVCHSIPDGVGLAIETPIGTVVHTGDFKLDPTPIDGRITDYSSFAEYGRKGVLLMLSDSTNVERSGFTPSERIIGGTLERLFRLHRNRRIVIAAFASNLHRTQQVISTAARFNRKVALMGRSMIQNVNLARELGYIDASDDLFIPMEEAENMQGNRLVVLTTGSQGEPFSGLVLMSKGEHRHITLGSRDLVAVFASPIPGNEKLVSNTINRLYERGCEVIYDRDQQVHVSGHASIEELKMMISMVRPRYFVPVHGEYRHLVRHAQLASEMDIPQKNIFVLQNGDALTITPKKATSKQGAVQAGGILVDGMALGEMQGSLLRERRDLSEDGLVALSIMLDRNWRIVSPPVIESIGFIHMSDARELRDEIRAVVEDTVKQLRSQKSGDLQLLETRLRSRVRALLKRYSKTYPVILPLISAAENE